MYHKFSAAGSTPQQAPKNTPNFSISFHSTSHTFVTPVNRKRKSPTNENEPGLSTPLPSKRPRQGGDPFAPLPTPSSHHLHSRKTPSSSFTSPMKQATKLEQVLDLLKTLDFKLSEFLFELFKHDGSHTRGRTPRHAGVVSRFLKGNTKYSIGVILQLMLSHPDGYVSGENNDTMWSFDDYTNLKTSARSTLRSFAIQTSRQRLIYEAKRAVLPGSGLHASLRKNSKHRMEWNSVGVETVERTKKVLQEHQRLAWSFMLAIAGEDVAEEHAEMLDEEDEDSEPGPKSERRPPALVVTHALSSLLFTRNNEVRLLPLSVGLLAFASSVPVDIMAYLCRIGIMPAYTTIVKALKALAQHGKSLVVDHAQDPSKAGFLVFDNVQNHLRVRDPRVGRSNHMNIGLAATYCELNGVDGRALLLQQKHEALALRKRVSVTTKSFYELIDHVHLDQVMSLHWLRVLVNYVPQLEHWKAHVSMLFSTRVAKLPIPALATPLHPLSSSGKSETVTTELKDALLDFLDQMGIATKEHEGKVVIAGGDGLTFQRVQEVQAVQRYLQLDVNVIDSLAHLEPVLASWHTEWTDLSRIFELFWDSLQSPDPSSLGHSAAKIGRTKMPNLKKVDYYPSAELMYLVLDVRMLDCWRNHFGCADLFAYFSSLKTPPDIEDLEKVSRKLHHAFSSTTGAYEALGDTSLPSEWSATVSLGSPWEPMTPISTNSREPPDRHSNGDRVLSNSILFLRDGLMSTEFAYAVALGDPGRVYEVIKVMLFTFAGSTHTKYVSYLLETITRLEFESTKDFREAILKSTLINLTGREGGFSAADLIQEYFNRLLEAIVEKKGVDYGAEFIRDCVSPNLHHFARIKVGMRQGIDLARRSGRHSVPHQTPEVLILLEEYSKQQLHKRRPGRVYPGRDVCNDQFNSGMQRLYEGKVSSWAAETAMCRGLLGLIPADVDQLAPNLAGDADITGEDEGAVDDGREPGSMGVGQVVDGRLILEAI